MCTFLILGKGQTHHRQRGWDTCYFWLHGRVVSLTLQHSILRGEQDGSCRLSPGSPACTDDSRPQPLPQWLSQKEGSVYGAPSVCGGQNQASPTVLSLSRQHCETVLLACFSKAGAALLPRATAMNEVGGSPAPWAPGQGVEGWL